MSRRNTLLLIIILLCSVGASRFFASSAVHRKPFDADTQGLYPLPPARMLRISSLDNYTTMADYLWIKLILTVGKTHDHPHDKEGVHDDEHAHHHGHEKQYSQKDEEVAVHLEHHLSTMLPHYIDIITDLDPRFTYPYLIGFIFSLADYSDTDAAMRYIEKGMSQNPEYWEFPYFYAFSLYRKGMASDSLILSYLNQSVKAKKSIRVFKKDLVYETYLAFYKKMHPDVKTDILLLGMTEAFDDPGMKKLLQERLKGVIHGHDDRVEQERKIQ